jgi:hypothetical protein
LDPGLGAQTGIPLDWRVTNGRKPDLGLGCTVQRGVLVVAPPHSTWADAYLRFGYLTKGVDLMQAPWRCCIEQKSWTGLSPRPREPDRETNASDWGPGDPDDAFLQKHRD